MQLGDNPARNHHPAPASHRQDGISHGTAKQAQPHIGGITLGPGADNCRRADIRRRHCSAVILQPVNGLKAATTYKMLGRYMRYLAPQRVKKGHFSIALQGQADMPALAFQRQIVTTCRHQRRNSKPGARTNDQ